MSDSETPHVNDVVDIDIKGWVDAVKTDPLAYRNRQVTEILLTAIGQAPSLKSSLVLKGGTLMALAYDSKRVTSDVDFTAVVGPEGFDERLREELDALLPRTAITLGYIDLLCRVQSIRKLPRPQSFESMNFPALLVKIGSAVRGTSEEKALAEGRASRVVDLEISFRDEVFNAQSLRLDGGGIAVRAFTLHELIAEKFRALLQQPIRNRHRRQAVYDIALLMEEHYLSPEDRVLIHKTLVEKCASRHIIPNAASLTDPDVVERAGTDWSTLGLEVRNLPPFEERFAVVADLYASLPWVTGAAIGRSAT
jgi:predicted nucleotidyltransferase component of viral defense system